MTWPAAPSFSISERSSATTSAYLNGPGCKDESPGPHQATGDFCRRFRRCDVLDLMACHQPHPQAHLARNLSTQSLYQAIIDRRRHPRRHRRRVQRGRQISPTTAPGAIIPCWSRWPTPRSRCTWSIAAATVPHMNWPPASSTGPSSSAARPASARFWCGGTPTSPRPSISTAGMMPATSASSLVSDARPNLVALAEQLAGLGVQLPGAAGTSDQDLCRGSDPHGTKHEIVQERGFETIAHARGDELPEFDYQAGGLRPGLSPDRAAQETGHREARRADP